MSVTLRNVAVTLRRNVAIKSKVNVIIITRKEGTGWSLGTFSNYKCAAGRRSGRGPGNGGGEWSGTFSHGGGEGRCRAFSHGGGE